MNEINKFCFYGFLKNLRFFEPFFLLFLRSNNLSYLSIGFLFSFREIAKNIMEIPSGAWADLYGRKTSLIFSFTSYIFAFSVFGFSKNIYFLYVAMFFIALGDAFRTGTHKAIIITYLEKNNLLDLKTKIYGYTRSWSKIGSACSVIIGTIIVISSTNYKTVFWFSIIPPILGVINLYFYPNYLNSKIHKSFSLKRTITHLWNSFYDSVTKKQTRALMVQSFIFTGTFEAIKDYIQIFIKLQIVALPIFAGFSLKNNIAILISISYFFIFILSSYGARKAHLFNSKLKANTSLYIFIIYSVLFLFSAISAYFNIYLLTIICFMFLFIIQNIWRPILISKFSENVANYKLATTLSMESQFYSLGVLVIAPITGYFADNYGEASIFIVLILLTGFYTFIYAFNNFKTFKSIG